MGTCHSNTINKLVIEIWESCITHHIWITACHIPGIHNSVADSESCKTRRATEWSLNYTVFQKAIDETHFQPDVDLFASRLNNKCKKNVSYQPDPGSYAVNAFYITRTNLAFYAFPPFCIIQKGLQKVKEDRATGFLVVPTGLLNHGGRTSLTCSLHLPLFFLGNRTCYTCHQIQAFSIHCTRR